MLRLSDDGTVTIDKGTVAIDNSSPFLGKDQA